MVAIVVMAEVAVEVLVYSTQKWWNVTHHVTHQCYTYEGEDE